MSYELNALEEPLVGMQSFSDEESADSSDVGFLYGSDSRGKEDLDLPEKIKVNLYGRMSFITYVSLLCFEFQLEYFIIIFFILMICQNYSFEALFTNNYQNEHTYTIVFNCRRSIGFRRMA